MDNSSPNVDEMLESMASEGAYLDSSAFTIDPFKAREKMSRYQFADGGLWLTKLVQAAVTAGAPQVRITLGRRKARVQFAPQEFWDAQTLLEAIFADAEPESRPISHLKAGLLGASGALSQSLSWTVGHTAVHLGASGSRVSGLAEQQKELTIEASRPSRGVMWSKLLVAPLEQMIRQTMEGWPSRRGAGLARFPSC